jgi:hypothetical protein
VLNSEGLCYSQVFKVQHLTRLRTSQGTRYGQERRSISKLSGG